MQNENLSDILSDSSAQEIQQWIKNVREGREHVSKNFNWLGLAEAATFNSYAREKSPSSLPNLDWAKVAVEAYHHLIEISQPSERFRFEHSIMLLRAYLLAHLGPRENEELLQVNPVVDWIFQDIDMPYDEVQRRAEIWTTLSKPEMLQLRRIKTRLSILRLMRDHGLLQERQGFDAWLSLWKQLP